MSKRKLSPMENQVSIMLQREGFKKALQIVNDTILEKQYSSTQTYWKEFKEELINQNNNE
jgi:hypothetical protein